jgi:hypothetical protein
MTEHARETTSAIFDLEPVDGSTLIVEKSNDAGEPEWEVIWRDDTAARRWYEPGDAEGQHWFRAHDEDPMELHQYLKYADAVHNLGPTIARLDGRDDED